MKFIYSLLTTTVFLVSTLNAQSELNFGEEVMNDGPGYMQSIPESNNHYYFTMSSFSKNQYLRVYRMEDNSLVNEYESHDYENDVIAVAAANPDFYYLIDKRTGDFVITKYDEENDEILSQTLPGTDYGYTLRFHSISTVDGKEVIMFVGVNDEEVILTYKKVVEDEIEDELFEYLNLTLENVEYKVYKPETEPIAVSYSHDKKAKTSTITYAEINEELELTNPKEFIFDYKYSRKSLYYTRDRNKGVSLYYKRENLYRFSSIKKNPWGSGPILFGKNSNYGVKSAEYFVFKDDKNVEFSVDFDKKISLFDTHFYPYQDHFTIVGTYRKKTGISNEYGTFSFKVDYSGVVLEKNITPLELNVKGEKEMILVSSFNDDESNTCIFELIERRGQETPIRYIKSIHAVKYDMNGTILWKKQFDNKEKRQGAWSQLSPMGIYGMNEGDLYIIHQDNPMQDRIEIVKISSEGKILEQEEYVATTQFKYLEESILFDDGRLILKVFIGKGFKEKVRYTNIKLW